MRLLAGLLCWLAIACATNAQTVEVRSGQHEGFIRLIIDLPERVDVKIENWRDEATITLPGQQFTFETSRVFDRISRDRIEDAVTDTQNATLRLKLRCKCEVTSFWHGEALLVLDVRDTDATFPPAPETLANTAPPDLEAERPISQRLSIPQGAVSLAASLATSQLQPKAETKTDAAETHDDDKHEPEDANDLLARETREHLVKQLSRAATQGLLSPRVSIAQTAVAEESPTTEKEAEPISATATPSAAEHINLRAQSSIDRDFLSVIEEGMSALTAPACADAQSLDVGTWGTDAPFAKQIGVLRKDLIGEFDQVNTAAVVQLAQLYLYFGLGAEARQTLSMADGELEDSNNLLALASIMEDGHATPGSPLANHLDCDGPAVLWSVLSHETLPEDTQINKDAALRSFDALPRQLRSHLGPVLSRRFLEAGDQQAADNVLRILNRHEETQTAGVDLLEAEIDLIEGENEKALEGLEAVVETNTELSAQALIELIDTAIGTKESVSFDHAVLAGAYLQQNKDGAMESDLARVYLTGLAASGAFDQSYEERTRLAPLLSPGLAAAVDTELLDQLTTSADEITFLRHVFSGPVADHSTLSSEAANATAARLLGMGFADAARSFVIEDVAGINGRERKLLRAKIAILDGQAGQAETELSDVTGDDADLLRANARELAGDHLTAAEFYAATGDEERSLRQAWLAEDWNRLIASEESTMSSGAALALLNSGDSEASDGENTASETDRVLSRNLGLIQQSSAARETIQDVLDASPSPGME